MSPTRLIATPDALAEAAHAFAALPRFALDTEFLRERTYLAELALVQLGGPDTIALVDPLAGLDPAPLVALLHGPATKVLHAARQDVEVLLPVAGTPPAPLLDTQVAAALLGHPAQIGYGDLVNRELGVTLAKGHARTDWSRRPLSAAQLEYAADDVRYLLPLAERLEERLEASGRGAWLEEECAALAEPSLYRADPADAWQRFRGIEALPPAEQLRLRAVARWREARAQRRNLPRSWVLPDDAAREIARASPADLDALRRLGVLNDATVDRIGREILEALANAAAESAEPLVQRLDGRPTPEEQALAKRLTARLKQVAADLDIAPEVLATQRDLRKLARGERDSALAPLRGWRRAVIGEVLLEEVARG